MASLVQRIKENAKKTGGNKGKFFFVREGEKARIRFLHDMDDGMEVVFHDSFSEGVNVPCQEAFGRSCPYCEREGLRTRSQYVWSVYDYESKEVKLFMFAVNNCSPLPALVAFYDNYGTIADRDYVVSVSGKGKDKSYAVIPMDKVKFRNAKVKPLSESQTLKIIDKAYPAEDVEDVEEEKPVNKKPVTKKEEASNSSDWDEEDGGTDYEAMKPMELYKLCVERKIEAEKRKPKAYYITLLEEWDAAQDDWGASEDEEEEADEWEDEE